MTAVQIRSTAAAFLMALSAPETFTAWAQVAKDDKKAVGQFIATTLGLAQAPTADQLIAIESAVLEMTGQAPATNTPNHVGFLVVMQQAATDAPRHVGNGDVQQNAPDVRAPRHVGFMAAMQQGADAPRHVGYGFIQQNAPDVNAPRHVGFLAAMQQGADAPRHVGYAFVQQNAPDVHAPRHNAYMFTQQASTGTLNDDQRRAVAIGFLGALASPAVFQAWSTLPKADRGAVAAFIQNAIGLAEKPSEEDLGAIEALVQEILAAQSPEVQAPRHVAFMVAMQQAAVDNVPRSVGYFLAQQQASAGTLNDAQRRAVAAGFPSALASPDVFQAWSEVPKSDRSAVAAFVKSACGLAETPTEGDLGAIEALVREALEAQPLELRTPRHVASICLMQQDAANITYDSRAPRSVGYFAAQQQASTGSLNDNQRRAAAASFLDAIASPEVFQAWSEVPKGDRGAVAAFVKNAIGLAVTPNEADLAAIEGLVREMLEAMPPDVRTPRHVGAICVMQQTSADKISISDADLRELLDLAQLTAGD